MPIRPALFIATLLLLSVPCLFADAQSAARENALTGVKVGPFEMDVATSYSTKDGLPSADVRCVAVANNGAVYFGTAGGLAKRDGGKWTTIAAVSVPVRCLAVHAEMVFAGTDKGVVVLGQDGVVRKHLPYPGSVKPEQVRCLAAGARTYLGTDVGLFEGVEDAWREVKEVGALLGNERQIRQIAVSSKGTTAVAALGGLAVHRGTADVSTGGTEHGAASTGPFIPSGNGWQILHPRSGSRRWALHDVRGVGFDDAGVLWFANPQGVGSLSGDATSLYSGEDGLPFDDATCLATGPDGVVWFGTTMGAIRFQGNQWFYRAGRAWLPDNQVRSIGVGRDKTAWVATPQGLGSIERRRTTLAEKARFFEDEIDKYHRRTPYGYVLEVNLPTAGDKSSFVQHDSDNDGLWTSMYGAGEAFAYGASKDPKAKERAKKAFEAVAFLSKVTQGGPHPAPKGFPARSILPTSGPDPNIHDSPERDRLHQLQDPLWKVITPRWPKSADGKWYWKTDTSSDELDGHYFFYAVYYDLAAETTEEKQRVREVVTRITDHLIDHDLELVDHDGKPTRWARFGPNVLNGGILVDCRGLNSLSILSYLKVTEHVTGGDAKYRKAYDRLVNDHWYAVNTSAPKAHFGPGTGNQSDDEMAFMCYYNLLKYETNPALLKTYNRSLMTYWVVDEPERNPLFDFIFLASFTTSRAGRWAAAISQGASPLQEGVETLRRFPLERVHWGFKNSHRKDIVPLRGLWWGWNRRQRVRGHLRDGKVLPIDERFVQHWNHDPWTLDGGGSGNELADGTAYLLPYYLGLYHGFIIEDDKK